MRKIKRLVVHHSASPRKTTFAEVDAWHRARGMKCIAYHFFVDDQGKIHPGRDICELGAHAKGANEDSVGVCLAGDNTKTGERWNHAQEDALLTLIDAFEFLIPDIEIVGHRDVGTTKTECPGLSIAEWLKRTL